MRSEIGTLKDKICILSRLKPYTFPKMAASFVLVVLAAGLVVEPTLALASDF